jgi:hypothetical protein
MSLSIYCPGIITKEYENFRDDVVSALNCIVETFNEVHSSTEVSSLVLLIMKLSATVPSLVNYVAFRISEPTFVSRKP